jgi:hypothetical protein
MLKKYINMFENFTDGKVRFFLLDSPIGVQTYCFIYNEDQTFHRVLIMNETGEDTEEEMIEHLRLYLSVLLKDSYDKFGFTRQVGQEISRRIAI